MIDIHCHILPSMDDGSPSLSESVAMARAAVSHGIKAIVATPHVMDRENSRYTLDDIKTAVAALQSELDHEGIGLRIHVGAEYFMDRDLPGMLQLFSPLATLGQSQYLLMELPGVSIPEYIEYSVLNPAIKDSAMKSKLLLLRPIVAHPERNMDLMSDWQKSHRLRNLGYMMQINLGSIIGYYGKKSQKVAETLFKNNLVDLVATDGHNSSQMDELLTHAPKVLQKLVGEQRYRILTELNPQRIISGEAVDTWES